MDANTKDSLVETGQVELGAIKTGYSDTSVTISGQQGICELSSGIFTIEELRTCMVCRKVSESVSPILERIFIAQGEADRRQIKVKQYEF